MGSRIISKDYASEACWQVPLLVRALREQHNWRPHHLAEAADIAVREVSLVETPGHLTSLDILERVANAFDLSLEQFFKLAAGVPLPANRSLAAWPPLQPLALPPPRRWLVRPA